MDTHLSKDMHAVVGVVTSIDEFRFTIAPVGEQAETVVSTDNATTFRENSQPISSTALQVGSQVALIGVSTSSATMDASVVSIL